MPKKDVTLVAIQFSPSNAYRLLKNIGPVSKVLKKLGARFLGFRWICDFCQDSFPTDDTLVWLKEQDKHICPECLAKGLDKIPSQTA